MQIIINITAESIKNLFTGLGIATFILLIGYPIAKFMRKFKSNLSKTDILNKSKEVKK